MALSNEEKMFVNEAIQVYIQIAARQMPPQHVQQLVQMGEEIVKKLDQVGAGKGKNNKPAGITDEWFKKVCSNCDKLAPSGCTDKVTEKFPGKCDPILHYENSKARK